MIKSTIQCPACRAIFNARAVAKRAAPAHAEALLKATDALVKIHAMPTAPDVLMAEMLAGMAVEEATIRVVSMTFAHLPMAQLDAKVDEIMAEANAAHAAELSRLQESRQPTPEATADAKVLPFNPIRFPQKGGDA